MQPLLIGLFAASCRPSTPTGGLQQPCEVDGDCAVGQVCHAYTHFECPDQQCRTCEIPCASDRDCPAGLACNTPPLVPDQIGFVCE